MARSPCVMLPSATSRPGHAAGCCKVWGRVGEGALCCNRQQASGKSKVCIRCQTQAAQRLITANDSNGSSPVPGDACSPQQYVQPPASPTARQHLQPQTTPIVTGNTYRPPPHPQSHPHSVQCSPGGSCPEPMSAFTGPSSKFVKYLHDNWNERTGAKMLAGSAERASHDRFSKGRRIEAELSGWVLCLLV